MIDIICAIFPQFGQLEVNLYKVNLAEIKNEEGDFQMVASAGKSYCEVEDEKQELYECQAHQVMLSFIDLTSSLLDQGEMLNATDEEESAEVRQQKIQLQMTLTELNCCLNDAPGSKICPSCRKVVKKHFRYHPTGIQQDILSEERLGDQYTESGLLWKANLQFHMLTLKKLQENCFFKE